jgi:hypothetical protein
MLQLQKAFNELDGEAATIRDRCVKSASVEIADLKYYAKADDFPEKDLCFYKCFYEETGFLNGNGKMEVDRLELLPELSRLEDEEVDKIKECIRGLDKIVECTDLRMLEQCFTELA